MIQNSTFYAGTSGWAYPTWKPGFYPADVPARRFLEHYATRLNSVEVNLTFRKQCTTEQLQGWIAATPAEFRFSFKVPQGITHMRRLRACDDHLADFLKALRPVVKAGRQGCLLFQFPPNFRAQALGRDSQENQSALAAFLKSKGGLLRRSGWRVAMEFRDASWFNEAIYAALRRANAALCIAHSDALATPDVVTTDFYYARLRASRYTESRMKSLTTRLSELSRSGDVYCYCKHEDAPDGPLRAEKLRRRVAKIISQPAHGAAS